MLRTSGNFVNVFYAMTLPNVTLKLPTFSNPSKIVILSESLFILNISLPTLLMYESVKFDEIVSTFRNFVNNISVMGR